MQEQEGPGGGMPVSHRQKGLVSIRSASQNSCTFSIKDVHLVAGMGNKAGVQKREMETRKAL